MKKKKNQQQKTGNQTHTHYFSHGAARGFNTEHANGHIRSTKIIHSQQ